MCDQNNETEITLNKPRPVSKRTKIKVDTCIAGLVQYLNDVGVETLGSCCGHGNGPASLLVDYEGRSIDIFDLDAVRSKDGN